MDGKPVAVVTGGSRGIGAATARALGRRGCHVIVNFHSNEPAAEAVVAAVRAEGGSATATAFLSEDLVDRILIYRAPIIVGEGKSSFGYVGLDAIADAHGRWQHRDGRALGIDRLEVYERVRESD